MNNNNILKYLIKGNNSLKNNNSNKTQSYFKLITNSLKNNSIKTSLNKTKKVIKNKKKLNNLLDNNCIIKTELNKNNSKKINNNTINNSKEIVYNNICFSLNNSILKNDKEKYNIYNYNNQTNNIKEKYNIKRINTNRNNKNKLKIPFSKTNKINLIKTIIVNKDNKKNKILKPHKKINKNFNSTNYLNNPYILYKIGGEIKDHNIKNNKTESNINNNIQRKKIKKLSRFRNVKTNKIINDMYKTPPIYYSLTENNSNAKTLNSEFNDNLKEINYIQNKKNILRNIEIEKEKLINESYNNYKKYLYLIQKQQQEYKEYKNFLKKELNQNNNIELELKKHNDNLKKGGAKSYFNLIKNKNLQYILSINTLKEKNKLLDNNYYFNNNNNNLSIDKSIQKYFLLKKIENDNKIDNKDKNNYIKTEYNDKENNNINNKKIIKNNNDSTNLSEIKVNKNTFKKLNIEEIKIKLKKKYKDNNNNIIYKTKNNNLDLNNLHNNSNNIIIKTPNQSKRTNYFDINTNNFNNNNNIHVQNNSIINNQINQSKIKQILMLKNRNVFKTLKEINELKLKINNSYNNKAANLSLTTKNKSLFKLNDLDDYIGPNQYGSIIAPPNNKKKIFRIISEEKKRSSNLMKKKFKLMENKRNIEYYSQTKNREIKDLDDYYNKKDLDRIVLSSEKKSKYNKLKKEIYDKAFKPCKYIKTDNLS